MSVCEITIGKMTLRAPRLPWESRGPLLHGDAPTLTKTVQEQFVLISNYLKKQGNGFELDNFYTSKFAFLNGSGTGFEFAFISHNHKIVWRKIEGRNPGSASNYIFHRSRRGVDKVSVGHFLCKMETFNFVNAKDLALDFYSQTLSLLCLSPPMRTLTTSCRTLTNFEERYFGKGECDWKSLADFENDLIVAMAVCLRLQSRIHPTARFTGPQLDIQPH